MTRRQTIGVVVVIGLAVFTVMAIAAAQFDTFPGDHTVMRHAQRVGWFDPIAHFFNVAVDDWIIRIGAGVFVVVLLALRQWPYALAFTAVWTAPVLTMLTKEWVGRPRPEGDFEIHIVPDSASFPSGHAFNGAIFATLVAFAAVRWLPRTYALAVVVACVVFAGIAGFARFWLGVHWLSDAIGGWILAFCCGAVAWLVAEYLDDWRRNRHIRDGRSAVDRAGAERG